MAQRLKRKRIDTEGPRKVVKAARVKEVGSLDRSIADHNGKSVFDETSVNASDVMDGEEHSVQAVHKDREGDGGTQTRIPFTSQLSENNERRPPVGGELRTIREASDLFKSTSFKLQIDALLPNVRPKPSRTAPLERFLFTLHSFLKELPSIPPQHPLEASRELQKKGVAVPYPLPLPTEETNWKVAFEAPSDITLVGSWANKISVKSKDGHKYGVDLAVEMPYGLFQEKDHLNGRFFHKRAFYLATIASAIRQSNTLKVDVKYQSLAGDCRLTKLVLTAINDDSPTDFTKANAKVCILAVPSADFPIPLHRLSPAHSNLRVIANVGEQSVHPPSSLYNTALLRTITPKYHLLATHEMQNDCLAFSDALTLLRIWANQRGFGEGTRMCVRGFEGAGPWWSSVLALLLHGEEPIQGAIKSNMRRSVGKGLSSYQLFKAALEFLAKHDFEKNSVFVKAPEGHRYPTEDYHRHPGAVFVDSASLTNLLSAVPLGSLNLLCCEASETLEMLNQTTPFGDPFTGAFLKDRRDLMTRFDVILRINLAAAKPSHTLHDTLDAGSSVAALLLSMDSILRQGLGDRSRAVAILHPSSTSRPVSQAHPSSPEVAFIGILHNPQNAFRLVDHGPAADGQQDALEKFRQFWGDKSELRRFKDGRILESVVWEVTAADERAHVPTMIVRHLLKLHFGLADDVVETWQTTFDSLLRLPPPISGEYLASGISTGFRGALNAFDNLVKTIKSVEKDLPLSVLTVSPNSESLRYTNVFSPVPLPSSLATVFSSNARYLTSIEILLEFEKSSRWPDDLKAIQSIKLAFFERLASALMQATDGLSAKVVIGDGVNDSAIVDKSFLEIVTPDGWAFATRIWHEREAELLDRMTDGLANRLPHVVSKTKEKKKDFDYYDALEAKEVYKRRFIHKPRHHRAIAVLCHHHPAFSGTVRLVKRWLGSHWLLYSHITGEIVELICASFFVNGGRHITTDVDIEQTAQHPVPVSKERGFATVVQFLKDWTWEDGLFVPLYGTDVSTLCGDSVTSKAGSRSVWKVCTEYDPEGYTWAHRGPDLVVAHRIKALAKATWNLLQESENGRLNVQGLFIHPTDDYDFVIHLEPFGLTRYLHNVTVDLRLLEKREKYANKIHVDDLGVLPGFDPAQLLFNDLQRIYSDTFKLFYDPFGGNKFGGVWDPALKRPRPFRVLGGFSSIPIRKENERDKDKRMVILNQESVITEIERLGSGLIKKITISA